MEGFEQVVALQSTVLPPEESYSINQILELCTLETVLYKSFWNRNRLCAERTSAIMDCEGLATELEDSSGLDQEIEATQKEIDSVIEQNRRLIREQAVTGMPTEEFDERTATLNERYKAADEKLTRLKAEREDHLTRGKGIRRFLSALDDQAQRLEDWDEQAWNLLVSRVIIQKDGSAEFIFRGEITITVRAK